MDENQLSKLIIGAAIKIHSTIGPGLLESVYEDILFFELGKYEDISCIRQVSIPVIYEGVTFDKGFIADIIVNEKVILELKSVKEVNDMHKKQLLTYLRLTNLKLGLLINFNEELLRHGLTRVVNGL